MKYFTIKLKNKEFFIFFQNNQVYYSGQKSNYFKDNNIDPLVFFEKANKLLNKYEIKVPNNYSKQCFVDRSSEEIIKDLFIRDGYTEEAFENLNESIKNLFNFSSKFHHKLDQSKKKITGEIKASKEEAYLIFAISATLVNLISKKIQRLS